MLLNSVTDIVQSGTPGTVLDSGVTLLSKNRHISAVL